jgi:general secretion pathway protein D
LTAAHGAVGAGSLSSALATSTLVSQTASAPSGGQRFSGMLNPFGSRNEKPVTDPFAGRSSPPTGSPAAPNALAQGPAAPAFGLPNQPAPGNEPRAFPANAPGAAPAQAAHPQKQKSDELLVAARRSLAYGDTRQASTLLEQAKALQVNYTFLEDSPAKVEAMLRKYTQLMQNRASVPNKEIYDRQYAELLLEQADALIRWQRLDDAERLASDAAKLPVSYSPFETKPDDLLKRIAAAKNGGQGANPATANSISGNPAANTTPRALQPAVSPAARQQTAEMVARARAALQNGDLLAAERLAVQARQIGVPPEAFSPQDDRPDFVLLDIQRQRAAGNSPSGVNRADGMAPIGSGPPQASPALYNPANDPSRNVRINNQQPEVIPPGTPGTQLPPQTPFGGRPGDVRPTLSDDVAAQQSLLLKKIATQVAQQEQTAKRLQTTDPKQSLAILEEARTSVQASGLDPNAKAQFMRRLEREINDVKLYIEENQVIIKLEERNAAVRNEIEQNRKGKVEVQEKLALLVDEFNTLMDQQRYAEAEVLAKRANELAPEEPIVQQLKLTARLAHQINLQQSIKDDKQRGFEDQMASVDASSVPFNDANPIQWGDARRWQDITESRRGLGQPTRRRTDKELEIERKLRTSVSLQFHDAPLGEVMNYLARLAQVNLHLDPQGLAAEGVTSNTPITIDLSQEISLKSALNLILEPLHLSYVIKDEVLKVTSEQLRDSHVYTVTYNVADLVIPIPNFVSANPMTLALQDAMRSAGAAGFAGAGLNQAPPMGLANASGSSAQQMNPALLTQNPQSLAGTSGQPYPAGPGGSLGGGAQADFDSLIDLITSTVAPTTWDTVGGPGSIAPFATNLSLVVSQTQEVHDQIADLLDQLRRLQDLQVTIEVRFITLNDNFFERIGIDFDFDLDDDTDKPFQVFGKPLDGGNPSGDGASVDRRDTSDRDHGPSVTVGLDQGGNFSADLDVPFRQGSFPLATPQFGNFAPGSGATLGFAILSDLEAFFLIEAAQGDRRSNVLQAPKVTLFNGQSAVVSDTSVSPFVISVIPVVGDFAAAQQPVVVALSEGTHLTVQAVVSSDRRFVRMTVVPFFSQIGDVNTFTFSGSATATENSENEGPLNALTRRQTERTATREGTTVQLPTFSSVSVITTVSVPDGGTVLLGGIKRLSEGRSEFGVPILSKVPYVNRLFKNVGIGRETQSLMMMVTPRIIIQEEEERLLGIAVPTP